MATRKHLDLSAMIATRIGKGDYPDGLPGERRLAEEFGVSYMTARRAVQDLVRAGTLKPSRTTRAPRPRRPRQLQVSLILPAWDSSGILGWRRSLDEAVRARDGQVRPLSYVHQSDAVITDALASADDLIVLLPPPLPPVLEALLVRERRRVVSLFVDLSHLGIVSLDHGVDRFVPLVAAHLAAQGHRRTALLNTQGTSPLIAARMAAWSAACIANAMTTTVHDEPVEPFMPSDEHALVVARRLLAAADRPSAVFCTTADVARGVLRAAADLGLVPGRDLAVATCDQPALCRLNTPSLTTIEVGPSLALWEQVLAKVLDGTPGPLRVLSPRAVLVEGESTSQKAVRPAAT